MQKAVIDCASGQGRIVAMSAAEAAQRDAEDAIGIAQAQAATIEQAAETADRGDARQAVTNLQSYIDLVSPTAAQTTAAVKLLCRVAIILIRRALRA